MLQAQGEETDAGAQAALLLNVAASLPQLALDFEPDPASETLHNNAAVFVQLVYQPIGEWPPLYTARWSIGCDEPDPVQLSLMAC